MRDVVIQKCYRKRFEGGCLSLTAHPRCLEEAAHRRVARGGAVARGAEGAGGNEGEGGAADTPKAHPPNNNPPPSEHMYSDHSLQWFFFYPLNVRHVIQHIGLFVRACAAIDSAAFSSSRLALSCTAPPSLLCSHVSPLMVVYRSSSSSSPHPRPSPSLSCVHACVWRGGKEEREPPLLQRTGTHVAVAPEREGGGSEAGPGGLPRPNTTNARARCMYLRISVCVLTSSPFAVDDARQSCQSNRVRERDVKQRR